ncbi:FucI L-fucose isomerase and related proteins [Rhabdaerophilaceae bacterium]
MKPILVLALGRSTFDVPFAEEYAAKAFATLDKSGIVTRGPRKLLFDAEAARAAIANVSPTDIAGILLLQVTFTDASMTVEIAKAFPGLPLGIWAFPEPRAGGRLRLNSFCGLNLAAHALGRANLAHGSLYAAPDATELSPALEAVLAVSHLPVSKLRTAQGAASSQFAAEALAAQIAGAKIGLVGDHPSGFETCRFEPSRLASLAGADIEEIPLTDLFARARAVDSGRTAKRLAEARTTYAGLSDVDAGQLEKSLALHSAMVDLKIEKSLDAFAVRCWPETFTEYGCAICGPMGMMGEAGTPCACEADVMGALTTLLLSEAAGEPGWLVDIVDMDEASETGIFWHCGSAPISMRDPAVTARAQIHSNRKMPLLAEFTLKPGSITIARLTQTRNRLALVLGLGEVISAPMAFTGTSATVRFNGGVAKARDVLIGEMLEHHVAIVYGDHRALLEAWASLKGLPILDLTA